MSEHFSDALSGIQRFQLLPWELIPDLGLYMDQVVTLIVRTFEPLYGEESKRLLSAPMINNYVKAGLLPRSRGKKYSREQIALLSIIVALKQVCSMEEIRRMLALKEGETVEALYGAFRERCGEVIRDLRPGSADAAAGLSPALEFAILASGYHAGCVAALQAAEADAAAVAQASADKKQGN